jgi:hypothetical protein
MLFHKKELSFGGMMILVFMMRETR